MQMYADKEEWEQFEELFTEAYGRAPDTEEKTIVSQMSLYDFEQYLEELKVMCNG